MVGTRAAWSLVECGPGPLGGSMVASACALHEDNLLDVEMTPHGSGSDVTKKL